MSDDKRLTGWDTLEHSSGLIHILPINDLKPHKETGVDCWCRPIIDDNIVIHNSMDRRELYERGELLVS